MSNLVLKNLSKSYGNRYVFQGISYVFPQRGLVGIRGASGCGKTTLLKILACVDTDYEGSFAFNGIKTKRIRKRKLPRFRMTNVGFMAQDCSMLGLEALCVNTALPPKASRVSKARFLEELDEIRSSKVGLFASRRKKTKDLSGGERQRASYVRSLSNEPGVLICDEPTSALDGKSSDAIMRMLLKESETRLVIVSSHDTDLLTRYCGSILSFEEGALRETRLREPCTLGGSLHLDLGEERNPKLCFGFRFSHSLRMLWSKKMKTLTSIASLTMGFFSLCLASLVGNTVSDEVDGAISALIPEDLLFVSMRSNDPIGNVYSASESTLDEITGKYPDVVGGWGVTYSLPNDNFFKDREIAYVMKGNKQVVLPSFSVMQINDFGYLPEHQTVTVYPKRPATMQLDSVILGLPYADMVNLCFSLQILRNYESLGYYIDDHKPQLFYSLMNMEWSYEDEQVFNIVGVIPYSKPALFHSEMRWNEYVFEESMRFPYSESEERDRPWILKKNRYLSFLIDRTEAISRIREDRLAERLIFDCPSYAYNPVFCVYGETSSLNRAYVYEHDGEALSIAEQEVLAGLPGCNSVLLTTNGSFVAYPEALMFGSGFSLYLSGSEQSALTLIDAYGQVRKEEDNYQRELPSDCLDGSYLCPSGGFDLLPLEQPSEGRTAESLDEIVISKGLSERVGKDEIIFVGEVNQTVVGDYIVRDFRQARAKVVGYVDSDKPAIYVQSLWTVDFFRDRLGMSAFYLLPTGAVLLTNEAKSSVLDDLETNLEGLKATDPFEQIQESLEPTCEFMNLVLTGMSIGTLLMALCIGFVVLWTTVSENGGECRYLYRIGIPKTEIIGVFNTFSHINVIASGTLASILTALSSIWVHGFMEDSFGSSYPFAIPVSSLAICFAVTVVFAVFSGPINALSVTLSLKHQVLDDRLIATEK